MIVKPSLENKEKRKTFYLFNNIDFPIRACGILFYRKNTNFEFLLINNYNRKTYEDFGGKTDDLDKSFIETAAREAEEESNGIFKKVDIIKNIGENYIYNKNFKYMLFVVEINKDFYNVDESEFGDYEKIDKIQRTVKWFTFDEIMDCDNLIARIDKNKLKKIMNKINLETF